MPKTITVLTPEDKLEIDQKLAIHTGKIEGHQARLDVHSATLVDQSSLITDMNKRIMVLEGEIDPPIDPPDPATGYRWHPVAWSG